MIVKQCRRNIIRPPTRDGLTREGGDRTQTLGIYYGAAPTSAEIPVVITSRKAYPRGLSSLDAITVSAGTEYSLDGVIWTDGAGVWGSSRFIMVRRESNPESGLAVIGSVSLGALTLDFTIWTMDDPTIVNAALWQDGDDWTYETPFEL
jgi:hypothetical protein